jgi:Uncharacterised nucleotidyltransferase
MNRDRAGLVAAYGLDMAPQLDWGVVAGVDRAEQLDLVETCRHERITGMAVAAWTDGALVLDADVAQHLVDVHETALASCLQLDALLLDVVGRLGEAGIPSRALKGASFAYTAYPSPEWRTYGDIDVLVPGHDWDAAAALLVDAGGELRFGEPRPGFTARFGKGRCLVVPAGFEIDLHRTFASGPFGLTVDPDELFSSGERITIGGAAVEILTREHRCLHAAAHAVLGSRVPRLSALRDVAAMVSDPELDHATVLEVAGRWRLTAVLARAVQESQRTLGLRAPLPLAGWAAQYQPTRFESRSLDAYVSSGRSYAAQAIAGVRAIRGVRGRAAYAWALVHPDRSYLAGRDGRYQRRLVRAWKTAARRPDAKRT